jgi:hypothetical protein
MATTISVPFKVLSDDGIREGVTRSGGPGATVRMRCLFEDHYDLVRDLMGTSVVVGGSIVRTPPFAYPASTNLYCTEIPEISGGKKKFFSSFFPSDGNWIASKYSYLTVVFTPIPYDFDGSGPAGQPWTSLHIGVSGEFLSMPQSHYKFADGVPTTTGVGKVVPQQEISLTRHFLPYLPVVEMDAQVGKVNGADFTIGAFTYLAGTLLFLGGENEYQRDTAGNTLMDLDYKFLYRKVKWNYYKHPSPTHDFEVVTDGNGDPVYEDDGDFSLLP